VQRPGSPARSTSQSTEPDQDDGRAGGLTANSLSRNQTPGEVYAKQRVFYYDWSHRLEAAYFYRPLCGCGHRVKAELQQTTGWIGRTWTCRFARPGRRWLAAWRSMITWTLVFFVYSGSGMMIQSSITGYSSQAECNKAGSNWITNEKNKLKGYYCVSLKIKSGPRR